MELLQQVVWRREAGEGEESQGELLPGGQQGEEGLQHGLLSQEDHQEEDHHYHNIDNLHHHNKNYKEDYDHAEDNKTSDNKTSEASECLGWRPSPVLHLRQPLLDLGPGLSSVRARGPRSEADLR